jgi:HSP20 family protein
MKNEAPAPKHVAIQQTSLERLLKEVSDWSGRIATRAYELFTESGATHGHDVDDWFRAEHELLKPVALDVKDLRDGFVIRAEVPGFDARDLNIHLNGCRLVIEGNHDISEDKKEKAGQTIYSERRSRQIYRSFELPVAVVADKAVAELTNGVLELKLPKAEPAKLIKAAAA